VSHRSSASRSGTARLRRAARRIRNHFKDEALIVFYHRVASLALDPNALCVSPRHFAEQLEILRERFEPVPLLELLEPPARRKRRRRAVALTFDDGYADCLDRAKPLLERFDVPATVFVTTGPLDREDGFWWDELERVLLHTPSLPPTLPLAFADRSLAWDPDDAANPEEQRKRRLRLYHAFHRWLLPQGHEERRKALDVLRDACGCEAGAGPEHRVLGPEGVLRLAEGGLVDVGAHTVTHPVLSSLPIAEQRSEIRGSRSRLEAILNRPVRSFAYPFGTPRDFDAHTRALVEEAGFSCACSTERGRVEEHSDRFRLPRFAVRDWDGDKLARRLFKWMHD
jgi:peptidoglycan/xylan/chitin deacetylase (PgdA/CDA1 family)